MGDINVLVSALHGYCRNWKDTNVTTKSPSYHLSMHHGKTDSLSPPPPRAWGRGEMNLGGVKGSI